MRRESAKKIDDELRAEYDLSQLKGGVRGKYYKRAMAGTNLVLIEPALAKAFPDAIEVCINNGKIHLVHGRSEAWRQAQRSFCDPRIRRTELRSIPLSWSKSVGALLARARSAWFHTYSAGLSSGA